MLKEIEMLLLELLKSKVKKVTNNVTSSIAAFIGWFLMTLVLIVVLMFALSFIALAITFLLAEVMPLWGAALITVGIFLLEIILLFVFREKLFIRPVKRKLLQMIDDSIPEEL